MIPTQATDTRERRARQAMLQAFRRKLNDRGYDPDPGLLELVFDAAEEFFDG